jgi:hypothetical protein
MSLLPFCAGLHQLTRAALSDIAAAERNYFPSNGLIPLAVVSPTMGWNGYER